MNIKKNSQKNVYNFCFLMHLYNTLSHKKEKFIPIKTNAVGLYTCGPTVYNYAHIGNLRTYIFEDLLKRTLLFNGYKVKHVMNITDVGHLTSDADSGEDKMQIALKRENLKPSVASLIKLAQKYTKSFKNDLTSLKIIKPDIWCQATKHIKEIVEMNKKLEKNGYTYETGLALYFDVTKFKDYTKLSKQKLEDKNIGARDEVEIDPKKKHPADFALWFKLAGKNKNHLMRWPSPWGEGFPGWHIECSAMSTKYLGNRFDIHCGGVDHIAVHHTNEIAQNDSAFSHQVVNFWLHGEFLIVNGGDKMAKSGENFFTLGVLKEKGFNPLAYRYLALNTHYKKPLQFTWEALNGAQNSLERLYEKVRKFEGLRRLEKTDKAKKRENKETAKACQIYKKQFLSAVNDDLDLPKALAITWKAIKSDKPDEAKKAMLHEFDKVLGLGLDMIKPIEIPEKIKKLAKARTLAREKKDWKKADELRREIENSGFAVEDAQNETKISPREI